jgi:hypothetical protein
MRSTTWLMVGALVVAGAACKNEEAAKTTAAKTTEPAGKAPSAAPTPAEPSPAAAAPAAPAAGTDCAAFAGKIVKLFVEISGKDSMFTDADLAPLTEGCTKENTLTTHPAGVACIMKSTTKAEVEACQPSMMAIIKDMMKNM